jgi:hypothetical protein
MVWVTGKVSGYVYILTVEYEHHSLHWNNASHDFGSTFSRPQGSWGRAEFCPSYFGDDIALPRPIEATPDPDYHMHQR